MRVRPFRKRFSIAVVAVAIASLTDPGNAQVPESITVPPLEAARILVSQGQWDAAQALLQRQDQEDVEVQFLEGQIAGQRGDWAGAERYYRKILDGHPELARARLELGRALFGQEKDVAAEWHFRRALA